MLFTLQETVWQLTRNKGRTVILLLASAMLAGCMAFYLGNILANEEALEQLANMSDVHAFVTNGSGSNSTGLNIASQRCDNFTSNPFLENFLMGGIATGAYSEEARMEDPFEGGDVNVIAINSLDATYMPDGKFTYLEGYDSSFLAGNQALCIVNDLFAEENNIKMGDSVSFPVYLAAWQQGGLREFTFLGEHTLKVVGFSSSYIAPQHFIVPVDWLRETSESQDVDFKYSHLGGVLKNPRELNQFKDSVYDMSFLEPNPDAQDEFGGVTIVVDDEQYISSAETLGENIKLFRRFLIPFFALVLGLIVLAIFLIMRNSQWNMAIACSLGRPKFLSGFANFLAAFSTEVTGCLLIFPIMVLGAKLSIYSALTICGTFLICSCAGDCLALALLLRFDTLTLLTAVE